MRLVFSRSAFRQLTRLKKATQRRIIRKLEFYLSQKHHWNSPSGSSILDSVSGAFESETIGSSVILKAMA
jgi:hypothetical protein